MQVTWDTTNIMNELKLWLMLEYFFLRREWERENESERVRESHTRQTGRGGGERSTFGCMHLKTVNSCNDIKVMRDFRELNSCSLVVILKRNVLTEEVKHISLTIWRRVLWQCSHSHYQWRWNISSRLYDNTESFRSRDSGYKSSATHCCVIRRERWVSRRTSLLLLRSRLRDNDKTNWSSQMFKNACYCVKERDTNST